MKKPVLVYGLCLLLGATMLFGCSDDSNNLAGALGGDPGAAAITLNSNDVSLVKDTTFQLVPSVSGVTYTSSNPAVVTVAADGTLTAIAAGTARITVELNGVKTYCDVIVTNTAVAVTGMSISKARTTLAVGNTETLSAAVIPLSATNKNITWSSSDDTKASVDAGGKVTAVAAGEATITATSADGSKTAVCVVTVMSNTYPVESVSLNKSSTTILAGSSETLYASFVPVFATNQGLSWSSSDTNVATVEVSGRVRAIAAGSTTITITSADGSKTAACTVTVSATEVPVTGVSLALDKMTARIVPGGFEQLTATVAPTGATNQNVVWTSSNEACATVDQTGLVKGIAAGSANITVTTNDGSQFKTCAVTVSSTPNKWRNIVGSHDARVLVASASAEQSNPGTWVSKDYGYTWKQVNTKFGWGMDISPDGKHIIVVGKIGSDGSAFYSHDYGNTWTDKSEDFTGSNEGAAISNDGQIMYVGVHGGGLWRSTDGGVNFTNIHNESEPDNRHNMTDCTPDGKTVVNVLSYQSGHVFYHTSADTTNGSTGWGKITNATVANGVSSLRKMLLSRDGRTIVVNAGDEGGKTRISTNYAEGWTTWSDFNGTSQKWFGLAANYNADGSFKTVYASAGSSESECKIYKTTDMSTWSEIAAAKSWSGIVASNDGKILVALSSDSTNGGIYVALDGDAATPTFARRY